MRQAIGFVTKYVSIDAIIYIAILLVLLTALLRCVFPLAGISGKLRRATRTIITENRQRKEKGASWRNLTFLGRKMESIWADFLQNAERCEAHGETCDVSDYVNEDSVLYTVGSVSLAELTPGILTSLGILGTFLGLVRGLYGLRLDAADTENLLAAMQQLIGGMSTAFMTSIVGVSASLVFSLLNNRQMTGCRRAVDRFCDSFSLYAMPKPVSPETELLAQVREQTAYLRKMSEDLSASLSQQLEAGIQRGMLPVQRSMDNFILASTQAQVEGVDRIVQLFLKRMSVSLAGEMEEMRHAFEEMRAEYLRSAQEMRAAEGAIGEMARDVIHMQQMNQGLLEHFRAYVTDMNESRTKVDEDEKNLAEMIGALQRREEETAALLAKLTALQKELAEYEQARLNPAGDDEGNGHASKEK
ncbi:MAG: MotA/TolQ/ExbB proton channel family protein [Clostridiales bacterium]|nr:MotA/TolQ/ExbB proton channel family protein [Clostridiales bacterium]